MTHTRMTQASRAEALRTAAGPQGVDILVVGGGITGAGIALDAATRGLTTAIIEAQDWSSGTSSRSSKLIHGGLRYLQMLDFKLVHEALTERDLLFSTIAPHLVRPVPFLYPLFHPVWERAYVGAGIGLYDALAHSPGRKRAMPMQKHLTRTGMLKLFPDFKADAAVGAVRYYDAKVDDARLVLTIVRTAVEHGALAASRTQLVKVTKSDVGIVNGADVVDLMTGQQLHIAARTVINATGVWTEQTEDLAGLGGGLQVLASKGAHIVVPRERINGRAGIITQTEKSVLFIIPWERHWIIGTTDTPWDQQLTHPVATSADIDYVLAHANRVLANPLTRADVVGVFAGLRPLLQPGTKDGTSSTRVSREHTVASPAPGLVVIAGGKLTTYRVMAKDAVDFALGEAARSNPAITASVPLLGAEGFQALVHRRAQIARTYRWDAARVNRLLGRYGTLLQALLDLIEADESLARPLAEAPEYLRAEIRYAAEAEGVLHIEDVMAHRTRLVFEHADRGVGALAEIADLIAPVLGWDDARRAQEIQSYIQRADAEKAAESEPTDAAAEEVRLRAADITPLRDLEVTTG